MTALADLFAIPDDDWVADALCAQVDADLWFPPAGMSARDAKRVCAVCPVRTECLNYAMEHHDAGVWGGFSERDRDKLRRGQNPAKPRKSPRQANGHGFACRCVLCRVPA